MLFIAAIWVFSTSAFAATTTVVGTVNYNFQIVAENGATYEVADTDKGGDLLFHVGLKVSATGTVSVDEDGTRVIDVLSFTLLEEQFPAQSQSVE